MSRSHVVSTGGARARRRVVAGVIALVLTGAAGSSADAASGPRVEVDAREIDLGTVVRGETVKARFVLRNTGDEVLRVLKAKPG